MKVWRSCDLVPIFRAILSGAALVVPRPEREEWFTEWTSELWYLLDALPSNTHFSLPAVQAMRFCLGSFKDALWLRQNRPALSSNKSLRLRSPIHCMALLAFLAATTSSLALWEGVLEPPYTARQFLFGQFLILGIALLILPAITNFALGEYPVTVHSPARAARLRRWLFLGMKFALILPIVFCGTLDLAPIISSIGIQPHAMLVGYVLAFRWALVDQRRRCPVCLRLLTNPVRIGDASHTMLELYGTELVCLKGHGLLHVPEAPRSSYRAQQWLDLDRSWRELFS